MNDTYNGLDLKKFIAGTQIQVASVDVLSNLGCQRCAFRYISMKNQGKPIQSSGLPSIKSGLIEVPVAKAAEMDKAQCA
jgi:hypothetical protein